MFPILDLVSTIGGMIIPPAFDFIKKKFIKQENDTPERTIGSLATTKPEVLPDYVKSLVELKEVAIKYFNRDVIGTPSQWVIDLRACIRPIIVCVSFIILGGMVVAKIVGYDIDGAGMGGIRAACEAITSSWMGDRIRMR